MSVSNRKVRQVVQKQGSALEQVLPALQGVIHNESLTRGRVQTLTERVDVLDGLAARGFWGRLRWLVTGR